MSLRAAQSKQGSTEGNKDSTDNTVDPLRNAWFDQEEPGATGNAGIFKVQGLAFLSDFEHFRRVSKEGDPAHRGLLRSEINNLHYILQIAVLT